jgi:hypothetical protein
MARDDCRNRWQTEQHRLATYRRQRATVHRDTTRSPDDIVTDAGFLDRSILLTRELMDAILDEHNAHTAGTFEQSQRPIPVHA